MNSFDESSYFTTWATAVFEVENPKVDLTEHTLRQIVHISASGENIRVKLSNKIGKTNLEIKEITISDSLAQGTGEINQKTVTTLYFEGNKNIIIPPGEEIYTDCTSYHLKALSEVAISIYFGEVPDSLTGHRASRTNSFIEEGNKVYNQTISKENKIAHWYFISAIEVSSTPRKKTIVCFGDSITDGTGSTDDKQNRWPDLLATKLHLNIKTSDIAVVNKGIGGNKITTQGIERYSYDVLEVKGVTHIIVLYGINDINGLNATSSEIISVYKSIIKQAHENDIFIFAGTIIPDGKCSHFTEQREKYRNEVNFWIRNTKPEEGGFDDYFDFDELIRDPNNKSIIYSDYDCGDGLHPSPDGYQRMVQAIDNFELFTKEPNFNKEPKEISLVDQIGIKFKLDFILQKGEEIIINIRGTSGGSNGFRVLTANDEGKKTSDYYYTDKIPKGKFIMVNIKLKAYEISNYIIFRRPISTLNLDNITLESIEVSTEEYKFKISPGDEGILL